MKKIDHQDILLILGVASIVGGIAAWSRPAAAIVFGLMCLFAVSQIERVRRVKKGSDGVSN